MFLKIYLLRFILSTIAGEAQTPGEKASLFVYGSTQPEGQYKVVDLPESDLDKSGFSFDKDWERIVWGITTVPIGEPGQDGDFGFSKVVPLSVGIGVE